MKICDFSFLLFLRKNKKAPKNLDFTRLFGCAFGTPDGDVIKELAFTDKIEFSAYIEASSAPFANPFAE